MSKKIFLLLIIISVGLFLRLYRIGDLEPFNHDEASNLIKERQLLTVRKPIFLGAEDHIAGKVIYYGPIHYYLMAPALLASNFDPLGPYIWTALLGGLTVLLIYLINSSLISAAFYAVFVTAVIYNRYDWYPNGIFLFSAAFLLALTRKRYFLAGFFAALAVQLHTTAGVLMLVPFFLWFRNRSGFHRQSLIMLLSGIVLGLSPMILFDLKNHFLYVSSYWNLLFSGQPGTNGFQPHYIFWFIPIIAYRMKWWPKAMSVPVIILSFGLTLYWLFFSPKEVARNMTVISQISRIIADNQAMDNRPFNVASFVDGNTRATAYRYFLDLAGTRPLGVEEYPKAEVLYVITYDIPEVIMKTSTYEISSFSPNKVTASWQVAGENIYRLEK